MIAFKAQGYGGRHTGCRGDKEARLGTLRETKHVERSHEGRLDRLHRVELIVRRGSRARKMINFWGHSQF